MFCFMGGNREYLLKEELMYFVKVELTHVGNLSLEKLVTLETGSDQKQVETCLKVTKYL